MLSEIDRITVHLERLFEAYQWWQEGQRLNCGEINIDEANLRLSEMMDVYAELAKAKREWVFLMPNELRLRAEAFLSNQAEEETKRALALLEEMDVLDEVITHLEAATQAQVN